MVLSWLLVGIEILLLFGIDLTAGRCSKNGLSVFACLLVLVILWLLIGNVMVVGKHCHGCWLALSWMLVSIVMVVG